MSAAEQSLICSEIWKRTCYQYIKNPYRYTNRKYQPKPLVRAMRAHLTKLGWKLVYCCKVVNNIDLMKYGWQK